MGREAAKSLRNARLELEQVNRLLLQPSPEALDDCKQRLQKAVEEMEAGRSLWKEAANDREAAAEALSARRVLTQAKRLLDNAALFHTGWRQVRAAFDGQYRSDGSLPELRCAARILVQG